MELLITFILYICMLVISEGGMKKRGMEKKGRLVSYNTSWVYVGRKDTWDSGAYPRAFSGRGDLDHTQFMPPFLIQHLR